MTVVFTEEELEYIVKEPKNWHVAEGCPAEMRERIEKKLRFIYEEKEGDWR